MRTTIHEYWGRKLSRRRPGGKLVGFAVGVIVVALALSLYFLFGKNDPGKDAGATVKVAAKSKVLETWSSGDKEATLAMTRDSLAALPLDPFFLSFNGIAAYYASSDKAEGDEKQSLLDEAVFSLRKALAAGGKIPVKAQVEYVLGKSYLRKGLPWYDLAAIYLLKSKTDGYAGNDTEQYLGLAYAGLQDHGKAVQHFEIALKNDTSDILMLSAAVSYKELGDMEKTAELLSRVTESATDAVIVQKARFMLGEIAMKKGDFKQAEKIFQTIIGTDPRSADAWYQMGLVCEALKDPIRARAAWRKATSIDPNNIEARKKLAERL